MLSLEALEALEAEPSGDWWNRHATSPFFCVHLFELSNNME